MPPSLTLVVEKIAEFSISCAPPYAQRASVVALGEGEVFVNHTNILYRDTRDQACNALRAFEAVTCPAPESTFYAFFHVAGVYDSVAFARMLIEKEWIGLAPGDAFFALEPGWFRLCFAQSSDQLTEAPDRLAPYLSSPAKVKLGAGSGRIEAGQDVLAEGADTGFEIIPAEHEAVGTGSFRNFVKLRRHR